MRAIVPALFTLSMLCSQSVAMAQAPEDDSALRANCVSDYFSFCAAYMPGSIAIRQCFGRNIARLTPACRNAIHDFDRRAGRGRGG